MMKRIEFSPPSSKTLINPDLQELKELIINFPSDFWRKGSGDASLSIFEEEVLVSDLLILPNFEFGYYLKFHKYQNKAIFWIWLTLADRSRLTQVCECSDEWFASVGLFITPEKAWKVIETYCLTGERDETIEWIAPDEIPETGNW